MRNKITVPIVALALTLILSPFVVAQDNGNFTGAGSVFQIGTDAKSMAMGGAFVAVADNYSAVYWNPAGLGTCQGVKLGAMNYRPYDLSKMNLTFGGASYTFQNFTVGGGFGRFGANLAEDEYAYQHEESYNETLILGSLGFNLDFASLGANLKAYSESAGGNSGIGFDVGMLANFDVLRLGVAAADIGGTTIDDTTDPVTKVQPTYRVGAAVPLLDMFIVSTQIDLIGDDRVIRAGMELKPIEQVAVRGGIMMPSGEDAEMSITAGAGLELAGLSVDIAYVQNKTAFSQAENTGDTLVLSAGFQFGTGQNEEQAEG